MNEGNGKEAGCIRPIAFVRHGLGLEGPKGDNDVDEDGLISGTPSRMATAELRGLAGMSLSSKAVAAMVT